jgi:anaerobic magnesium-protoporphyrin IX monomethyl ester cyclase
MTYRHALFLNPYKEASANPSMLLFPPTGLEYVASSAKGLVPKRTIIDLRYDKEFGDEDALLKFIEREVDIVFVGLGWDRQLEEIYTFLNRIPANIPLIVGGYTATEKVEEVFQAAARVDIIVRGEGEKTAQEILKSTALKDILGISYRDGNKIKHNANRPFLNVNELPAPDRSLRRYDYGLMFNGIRVANILFDTVLTTRGCPFKCKFCTFSLNPLGQKREYTERSVESVIEEIRGLKADIILFSDDNLFVNPKRAEKICDLLIKYKVNKRFGAQVRIDIAKHPAVLDKMVKAGFKTFFIGIESPHDWILTQLNKGFDQAAIREAFAVLRKYPILTNGYFLYGNLGETREEMLYIAQFAREIGVDTISGNKLRIEKYSPLKELAQKTPGYHVTERGELYSDAYSHAELKRIGKTIKHSFYTPGRYARIIWKSLFVIRFLTLKEILILLVTSPVIVASLLFQGTGKKSRARKSS